MFTVVFNKETGQRIKFQHWVSMLPNGENHWEGRAERLFSPCELDSLLIPGDLVVRARKMSETYVNGRIFTA